LDKKRNNNLFFHLWRKSNFDKFKKCKSIRDTYMETFTALVDAVNIKYKSV
jgi:hypothetical protein